MFNTVIVIICIIIFIGMIALDVYVTKAANRPSEKDEENESADNDDDKKE